MKTIFRISLIIISIFGFKFSIAQSEEDALRYSKLLHGGTARYMAMGGAFSALGADFSVLSTNPAGLGLYKKSEIVFTPSVGYTKTESKYLETTREDFKYNFNFTNFGMVFTGALGSKDSEAPQWRGLSFGFGVNRLQNFNGRVLTQGLNLHGSVLDSYHQAAQGIAYDQLNPFDTELAFNTYLLDTIGGVNNYVQAHYGGATQRKTISTTGGINEMVISFAGNYDDRLYIGATLGFPFVKYNEKSIYTEVDDLDTIANFSSLTINDELETFGTGFNFKMGLIYKFTDWVRISGAFHTPTFYTLTDNWHRTMSSDLEGMGSYSDDSPQGKFDYSLMTPMRVIGGIAFVIGNKGTVSAEYELVDYSESRLREQNISGSFFNQNEAIRANYTSAGNLRLGAEWVLAPFTIRGGYSMYGNPYKDGIGDGSENLISGGVGYREKDFFLDLSYVNSSLSSKHYLYPNVQSEVEMQSNKHLFVCTLGFKF